ncbi:pilus assembly protein [Rhodococcus erythropolis]|uniref:TadE family protein n=1 Tax=Rhodococcus erythropolis TaxID=1833 RepID=UPI001C9B5660|nr:TadE family protein [Rhodococcus erythropolis]MBY6389487.1 pilus assembly protein [Rhodococcus erythropolis]
MQPSTATPLARLRSQLRSDRGGVLETVIIWPVVLLLFFGAVQGALYFHARNVAMKAGEEGLRQARSQFGTSAAGTAAAYGFITQTGATVLRGPAVSVTRNQREATIRIVGQPISLIPFLNLTVNIDQSAPVERVTNPGDPW